jgi:ankyrin repeat protein
MGADVYCKDKNRETALHVATTAPAISLLLDMGADIDARNHKGESAIQLACIAGCEENVRVLFDRGANTH